MFCSAATARHDNERARRKYDHAGRGRMPSASIDHLASSLQRLDAVERALLELSLRRGVEDEAIGLVLRLPPGEVERRREAVLDRLADDLGLAGSAEREELRALLPSLSGRHWPADRERWARTEEERGGARRRRVLRVGALGIAAVAIAGSVVALSAGGGRESGSGADPRSPVVPLTRVAPAGRGAGTVRVAGRRGSERLELRVSGLPALEEAYEVWLYRSASEAVPLGRFLGASFRGRLPLPANARRYAFVDVSREPIDDNPRHSGESLLRAPLRRLLPDATR
jgi:hypothetical protein